MPAVAFITVWWCFGFSLLLFIAGLRNISSEIYEAAELDGAGRWDQFRRITWPLIWPVTVLVFTIQLILQLKIFDQVYLLVRGRTDADMVMVHYIFREAFQLNHGGLAAASAVVLFVLIVVLSVLQFQLLRARGRKMTASVEPRRSRFRRQPRVGWRGCDSSTRRARHHLGHAWSAPSYGRFRSIGGSMTTFKHEYEIVRPGVQLWPEHFTFENYVHVLLQTKIGFWYVNSLITSAAVTVHRRDDGGGRRLRDLAAQFPRAGGSSGG